MDANRGPGWLQRLPSFGVAAIALLLPVYFLPSAPEPFEAAKVEFFRYAASTTALFFLATRLGRGAGAAPRWPASVLLFFGAVAVLGASQIVATALSVDPRTSLWGSGEGHGTATFASMLLFFYVTALVATPPRALSLIVRALLVGSVPVMVYAFVQLAGLDPLAWETDSISPMLGTMGRSNVVGAYVAMLVPFTLGWSVLARRQNGSARAWAPLALLSMQYLCIFSTQARAAWLAAVVATLVSLVAMRRAAPGRRRVALVATAGVGVVLFLLMNVVNVEQLARTSSSPSVNAVTEHRLGTARSRLEIWRGTWNLSRERWLVGYGPETFAAVFDHSAVAPEGDVIVTHPHNVMLGYLFASGVVGLSAYLAVVAGFSIALLRWLGDEENGSRRVVWGALAGSITAYLVQAQFNPEAVVLSVLFWLNLGLVVASRPEDKTASAG